MGKPAIKTVEGWIVIALVAFGVVVAAWFVIHGRGGSDVLATLIGPTALAGYFARLRTNLKTLLFNAAMPQGNRFMPDPTTDPTPTTAIAAGAAAIATAIEGAIEGPVITYVQNLAQTEVAKGCTALKIDDVNAVAYFQAAGQNIVNGAWLALKPKLSSLLAQLVAKA